MRHQETKTTTEEVTRILREWETCDMCGAKIERETRFDIREGAVRLILGENYPEGGHRTELRADLCEGCFRNKLVPWLESQGVKMQTVQAEW